jgi:GAF domain.
LVRKEYKIFYLKGHVFTKGETLNVPNAYADERFNKEVDMLTGFKTSTILAVPIRDDSNKIIGMV